MPSAALTSPRFSQAKLLRLIVLLATLVAFRNSLDGAYFLDDLDAIHNNPSIRSLWPPWQALQPPRETSVAGRPLTNLTLAFNYAVHGVSPRGYHLVNLLIHAAAALTLFGLLRLLLRSPAVTGRFSSDADLLAGITALLWAVHPLQTESVTYIVQRTESLCGLAYLLTLYAFARSMNAPRPRGWRLACVLACFAGMACKEVMVTAPLMVLFVDRALFAASFRQALSTRRGLYLGLAATWIVPGILLAGSPRPVSAGADLPFGPMDYARTEASVLLHYLRLAIWPDPLILDYNWPISPSWSHSARSIAIVAIILVLSAAVWIRRPAVALPAVAFFLILAPTSSFYPILDAAFEHRMYLPLAGILFILVSTLHWILQRTLRHRANATRYGMIAIALIATTALTVRTIRRNADYADPVAFWRGNLEHGGLNNPRAWTNLSSAFLQDGQASEARDAALYAIRHSTDNVEAYVNLCAASTQLGLIEEGIQMGRIAVQLKPRSVEALVNLGLAYKAANRLNDARHQLMQALRVQEDCQPALAALKDLDAQERPGASIGPASNTSNAQEP